MIEFMVQLTSVPDIKRFVNIASAQDFNISILHEHYIVDAKSIMDIFSLDLSKSLRVEAYCGSDDCEAFYRELEDFIVTDIPAKII